MLKRPVCKPSFPMSVSWAFCSMSRRKTPGTRHLHMRLLVRNKSALLAHLKGKHLRKNVCYACTPGSIVSQKKKKMHKSLCTLRTSEPPIFLISACPFFFLHVMFAVPYLLWMLEVSPFALALGLMRYNCVMLSNNLGQVAHLYY